MRRGKLRWVGAIASRLFQLTLFSVLFLTASCCCLQAPGDVSALWRRLRTTLFLGTLFLVLAEGRRARQAIRALLDDLDWDRRRRRGPGCVLTVLGLGAALAGWATWFTVLSPNVHRVGGESLVAALVVIAVLAFVWTLATVETLRLARNGVVLLRLRFSAWRERATDEQRPTTLPLTVAFWSTCAFFVALGFPSLELLGGMLRFTLALLILMGPEAPSPGGLPATEGPAPPLDLLVTVRPGRSIADVEAVVADRAASGRAFPDVSSLEDATLAATYIVRASPLDAIRIVLLASFDEDVLWVDVDSMVAPDPATHQGSCRAGLARLPVNDPLAGDQSGLSDVGGSAALDLLAGRAPQRPAIVAIIDTGVDGTHPDLSTVVVPWAVSDDRDGHGTACAGVVAAVTDNGRGIASLNWRGEYVHVRSYAALAGQRPDADDVARAILEAAEDSADVINLSFVGEGSAPRVVQYAVRRAQEHGSIVVAAAGNGSGDARDHWPANIDGVLVVGATRDGLPASFSNGLDGVAHRVWAPGADVCTLGTGGDYERRTGTSMAAPMVSGVLGVMRALCPDLDANEAIAIVEVSGAPLPRGGHELRIDRALASLLQTHPACDGRTRGFGQRTLHDLDEDTGE